MCVHLSVWVHVTCACVSECYEMRIYPPAVKINLDTVEVRKPSFAKLNILAVWKVKCRKPK